MTEKRTYKAEGLVYGSCSGGGEGIYKAKTIIATTRKELIKQANQMLKDNTLDAGMGFEYLLGAMLDLEITYTITVGGKEYTRREYDTIFIGTLAQDQEEQLIQMFMQQ